MTCVLCSYAAVGTRTPATQAEDLPVVGARDLRTHPEGAIYLYATPPAGALRGRLHGAKTAKKGKRKARASVLMV